MAEATAGQAAFGWASEEAPNDEVGPARHGRPASRRRSARPASPQRAPANAGDAQLPPENELWDVHAAARFLKRSVSWVYHRAEDGTLPVRRLNGWGVRFIPAELRAWVESGGVRQRGD